MKKSMNKVKPSTWVIAVAIASVLGVASTSALAEDAMDAANTNIDSAMDPTMESTMDPAMQPAAPKTYTNDWQDPVVQDFTRLDISGNGLLLRNEASKGNAFNKKTFDQADANRDGYIDQNEYVYYKTGKSPEMAKAADTNVAADAAVSDSSMNEQPANMAAADTETDASSKRPVGVVIDDSLITTKAKAKILATKELKTLQISVQTREGEVTLSGLVDNEAAKMKAEEVVSGIEGVKSVNNGLQIRS
jgi:hyperosmotically inducible protein